jgi:DUF4097 and DUF4098 domain-containing protein YvlB
MIRQKAFQCLFGLLLIHVACSATAYCQEREEIRRSFTLNPGATISLENVSGDIKLSSWGGSEAQIVAVKTGPADQLRNVDVSINAQASRLTIKTVYPRQNNRVSVNFDLKVPRSVNLDSIRSVSGNIEIVDIDGRVIGHSVSGNVEAQNISRETNLDAVSGSVRAIGIRDRASLRTVSGSAMAGNIDGDLDAKSVSGDVRLSQVRGHIDAESVSGNVTLSESNPTGLKVSTVSGKIQFDGKLDASGRYDLKSHSGAITLNLPADSKFALQASTFSGSIKSDFEIKVNGMSEKKTLNGVVGAGGPTIELRSFSGDILIRRSGS